MKKPKANTNSPSKKPSRAPRPWAPGKRTATHMKRLKAIWMLRPEPRGTFEEFLNSIDRKTS